MYLHQWYGNFWETNLAIVRLFALKIIAHILREVVNRERFCGTNAFCFSCFRKVFGLSGPLGSTDTIYLCLGCWMVRWCREGKREETGAVLIVSESPPSKETNKRKMTKIDFKRFEKYGQNMHGAGTLVQKISTKTVFNTKTVFLTRFLFKME